MAEDAKNPAADKDLDSHAEKKGRAEDQPKTQAEASEEVSQKKDAVENSSDTDKETEKNIPAEVEDDTKAEAEEEAEKAATEDSEDKSEKKNAESISEKTAKNDETSGPAFGLDAQSAKVADNCGVNCKCKCDSVEKQRETFQEEIREQIENCKFEIVSSIQETVHEECAKTAEKRIRKVERRRRAGYIVRDIIILLLAAIIGYLGYCLYDIKYFDFMKSECERNNTCTEVKEEVEAPAEIIKDTAWYYNKYGYLFDNLQIGLNADKVEAYYLYSGDRKASEIQPNYLLGMAYNHLSSSTSYDSENGIVVPAADLRTAYASLVGNADSFVKRNFTYHCAEFKYDKNSDSFSADSVLCADNSARTILENIDEIYEEGNVLYFLTTATIFDRNEQNFYTFDNLFKPAVANVSADDLEKHSSLLNHYQYQFNKVDEKYYFSGITKLN